MLHNKLKKLRVAKGLNQKEFAAELGVEVSKYNKWENGKNSPDYETICKLADVFNTTTDYLLDRQAESTIPFNRHDEPFAKRLRELLEENKTTQEELAKIVGVKRQSIAAWKDGKSIPNIEHLLNISNWFGVTCDYLVGRSDARKPFIGGIMQFPVCKFAKTNSIKEQWLHLRSEAMEVQLAIVELREATTDDERFCKAVKVVEELADLRHSAETLARIVKREYPEIDLADVDRLTIVKNDNRRYYDD